jgi:hypothetical protein
VPDTCIENNKLDINKLSDQGLKGTAAPTRPAQPEDVIQRSLQSFLIVGRCLLEVRNANFTGNITRRAAVVKRRNVIARASSALMNVSREERIICLCSVLFREVRK